MYRDCVGRQDESISKPLDPTLFWMDNIFKIILLCKNGYFFVPVNILEGLSLNRAAEHIIYTIVLFWPETSSESQSSFFADIAEEREGHQEKSCQFPAACPPPLNSVWSMS